MNELRKYLLETMYIYEGYPATGKGSGKTSSILRNYKAMDYGDNPEKFISVS